MKRIVLLLICTSFVISFVMVNAETVKSEFTNHKVYNTAISDSEPQNMERTYADLYVSPAGDNANSGLSPEEPLLTIQYACSIIEATEAEPHTIYLAAGTYSPSVNGESYPIIMPQYISLVGTAEETTILDAELTGRVLQLEDCDNVIISDLTIRHGQAIINGNGGNEGGGIHLASSNCLTHLSRNNR
ncbi:MAG: DUF1565 domain-containing protein [Candidatus Stygibacter australis]|nr:DUF1565 domain-containing protein [Candidatus Stygibacter australis]